MTEKREYKQRAKLILIAILSIFLILEKTGCADMRIPRTEKKREKYYNKIIEQSNTESNLKELELKYDEEGFYISNKYDYEAKNLLAVVNKNHVISGCSFFPFREFITGYIVQYCGTNPYINKEVAIPLFTLVYHMLYLRFGNKDKSYKFYTHELKQEQKDEFYNFEVGDEVKEYMMNMDTKGRSAFYMNEEDIQLAKSLGLSTLNYDMAMELFDFVLANVKGQRKEILKDMMLPFISNREYFKRYAAYAYLNGVHVQVNEFASIYPKELREEYLNYQTVMKDKFKFNNEICIVLMPLFDLLRHDESQDLLETDLVKVHMTLRPEFGIGLALNKNMPAYSKLGYVINEIGRPLTRENLYLDYGNFNSTQSKNFISIPFPFKKSDFSYKKADFCRQFGCGGFNVEFVLRNKIEYFNHTFVLNEKINYPLLNIFKLINIPDSRLVEYIHLPKFQSFGKFDNEIEMKALNSYINFIKSLNDNTLDYEKIAEDINELTSKREALNKIINNKSSNAEFNLEESAHSITTKINLLTLAAEKKRILHLHLESLYEEFEKTLVIDLKKIKQNLFKY